MGIAKSIINELKKSVAMSELSQVEVPTQDYSMDQMAAKDCAWTVKLKEQLKDCAFGDLPREILLDRLYKLYASQVDDGLYDGHVKNVDPESGDHGQTVFKFNKFTLPGMVQSLRQKGYIEDTEPTPIVEEVIEEEPEELESKSELVSKIIENLLGGGISGDVTININKSAKEILNLLKGGKPASIGEQRTHKDGVTRKKTAEGWVDVKGNSQSSSKQTPNGPSNKKDNSGAFDNIPSPKELKDSRLEAKGTVTAEGEAPNSNKIDTSSAQEIKTPRSVNLSDTPAKIVVGKDYQGAKQPGIGYSASSKTLKPGMVINNFLMKRADKMIEEGVFSHKVKDGVTGVLEEHRFKISKEPSGSYMVKNIKDAKGQKALTIMSGDLLNDMRSDIFAKKGTSDQDIVVATTLVNVDNEVMMIIAPIEAESADDARKKVTEFLDKKLGSSGQYSLMKFSSESGRNFRPALMSQAAVANYVKKSENGEADLVEAIDYFYQNMSKK